MTPEALAALHAAAFAGTLRPWSSAEFASLLGQPGTLLESDPAGFALGRVAGPEAELLTLAVHPAARRRGLARRLVGAFEARAAAAGAEECLLEVALDNAAACALYDRLGYREAGRRPDYYPSAAGPRVDALLLRKQLFTARPKNR